MGKVNFSESLQDFDLKVNVSFGKKEKFVWQSSKELEIVLSEDKRIYSWRKILRKKLQELKNGDYKNIYFKFDKNIKEDKLKNLLLEIELSFYDYSYKNGEFVWTEKVKEIHFDKELKSVYEEIKPLMESLLFTKYLIWSPPVAVYPEKFVNKIKKQIENLNKSRKNKIKYEVIKGEELKNKGFGGIYAVGKGSDYLPHLFILKYKGKENNKWDVGVVGKGVIFDAGGVNLKKSEGIELMKGDMAGAGIVAGLLLWTIKKNLKLNVIFAIPLVLNVPSSKSLLPSDIIEIYGGKTVEVVNTDAEGRLIMADCLSLLSKDYKVEYLFDLATLTGACVVALGSDIAGMITNIEDRNFIEKIRKISWDEVGEPVWELPLFENYAEELKSKVADVKNTGKSRWAGTIKAGLFLKNFVEKDTKWIHFDIAGSLFALANSSPSEYSGEFGLRLMTKIFEDLSL